MYNSIFAAGIAIFLSIAKSNAPSLTHSSHAHSFAKLITYTACWLSTSFTLWEKTLTSSQEIDRDTITLPLFVKVEISFSHRKKDQRCVSLSSLEGYSIHKCTGKIPYKCVYIASQTIILLITLYCKRIDAMIGRIAQ